MMTERTIQKPNENNLSRMGKVMPEIQGIGERDYNRLRYLLIVEGNTELFYIKYLIDNEILNFEIRSFNGKVKKGWKIENGIVCMCGDGFSVEQFNDLNNYMDSEMRPKVICIFDLDACLEDSRLFEKYKELLQEKLNDKRKFDYYFCTSLPSIEYWFLLHYQQFKIEKFYRKIKSCKSIATEISKDKNIKFLNSDEAKKWFAMLCKTDNLYLAISRSKEKAKNPNRLDKVNDRKACNVSYSDLYKLFEIK